MMHDAALICSALHDIRPKNKHLFLRIFTLILTEFGDFGLGNPMNANYQEHCTSVGPVCNKVKLLIYCPSYLSHFLSALVKSHGNAETDTSPYMFLPITIT